MDMIQKRMTARQLGATLNKQLEHELEDAQELANNRKKAAPERMKQCAVANAIAHPLPVSAWLFKAGTTFYVALTVRSFKTDKQLTTMLRRAIARDLKISNMDYENYREFTIRLADGYQLGISAHVDAETTGNDCRIVEERETEERIVRRIVCS